MAQPVDRSILQEIVRIIEARKKVPERVRVRAREYLITYLEDHQRRLQDALQRYDSDRLNMLYGQLASRVKYQLLRRLPGREGPAAKPAARPAAGRTGGQKKAKPAKPAKATKPPKKNAAKRVNSKAPGRKPAKPTATRRAKTVTKKARR